MSEVKDVIKNEFKGLKDYIVLVTVDAKAYQKAVIDFVRFYVNDLNLPGVYVTLNKPYDIIQRTLSNNGIRHEFIIFIDAVSRTATKKIDNCLYIGSPEKLSDISVAMDQAVKALPAEEKFLIFDSLNTLAIFNNPGTVARFTHFLVGKIREWKIKGILITLDRDTNSELLNGLTQFSDARIDLGGKP